MESWSSPPFFPPSLGVGRIARQSNSTNSTTSPIEPRNQVEPAYARSDLFERRRVLMEQWAEFLAGGNREPKAVPIR